MCHDVVVGNPSVLTVHVTSLLEVLSLYIYETNMKLGAGPSYLRTGTTLVFSPQILQY